MVAAPGGHVVVITPPNTAGAKRSHPTWIDYGAKILWSEKIGAGNAVLKTAYADGLDQTSANVQIVGDYVTGLPLGDLEFPDANGPLITFQYTPGGSATPQIYVVDDSQPTPTPYHVANGFHPSISADGSKVAFVASNGTADQIFTVPAAKPGGPLATPAQVTNQPGGNPHSFKHPVWSVDGKSIVFEWLDATTGADVDTKSVVVGTTPTTTYTSLAGSPVTGLPAFQPQRKNAVFRLAGTDRFSTAIDVSLSHWGTAGSPTSTGAQAKAVVLSRSDDFADALGGSALAAKVGGPLLLTPTAGLTQPVTAEIQRVLGPGDGIKTVYVLGGIKALSPAVESALTALHYHVKRVSGADRYSTAVAIANAITNGQAPDYMFVATGQKYADALSAGAAAGAINAHGGKNAVVLLTNDTTMPPATVSYVAPLNTRTVLNPDKTKPANFIELDSIGKQAELALGGQWIPPDFNSGSYQAFSGIDRYQTSYLVAQHFFGSTGSAGLATGLNWADALSGGALMGTLDGPMLLISPTAGPTGQTAQWLAQNSGQLDKALIFGGNGAVAASVDQPVGAMISGPAGRDRLPVEP